MRVNPRSFFDYYIIHPMAGDLSLGERILSLVCSALLVPFTLGVFHLRSYLKNRKIVPLTNILTTRHEHFNKIVPTIKKVGFEKLKIAPTTLVGESRITGTSGLPNVAILSTETEQKTKSAVIEQSQVSSIIQDKFVTPYYATRLPKEEDVTVPYTDPKSKKTEWVKWSSLTREQKIAVNNQGTRPHNQLSPLTPEPVVNRWFFCEGQEPFLENDPRRSHGNDHCVRAALWGGVFGYLYQKYHPDYDVTLQDISMIQLIAAGHDSGRQTEGPDVYDEKSAENTIDALKSIGMTDSQVLKDAREAIAEKDKEDLHNKSLIAKCVQNADCADFSRLLLKSCEQDENGFKKAGEYLDIFNELREKAQILNTQHPENAKLKGDMTYRDFQYELEGLRIEMNDVVYRTHTKEFREQNFVPGKNYFDEVLKIINPIEHPTLNAVLMQIGIKELPPTLQEKKALDIIETANSWINKGVENLETEQLEKIAGLLTKSLSDLKKTKDVDIGKGILQLIGVELYQRKDLLKSYQEALQNVPVDYNKLILNYEKLPYVVRKHLIVSFVEKIESSVDNTVQEAILKCNMTLRDQNVVLVDILQRDLNELLSREDLKPSTKNAAKLFSMAKTLMNYYKKTNKLLVNKEAQTTAALAFEKAARFYLNAEEGEKAHKVLLNACSMIKLEPSHPLFDLKSLFENNPGKEVLFLQSDCGFLRKRKLRIAEKNIEGQKLYEMSFELPSKVRDELQEKLKLIPKEFTQIVPGKYLRAENNKFVDKDSVEIGNDQLIKLSPNVELFIGNDKTYWNHYHQVRIRAKEGVSGQEIQDVLSQIGLPMALMPSREEDIKLEVLARSLAFRFPELVYDDPLNKKSPKEVYKMLNSDQKAIVDKDVNEAKLTLVNENQSEIVQPAVGLEAWKGGVKSLFSSVFASRNFTETAKVMVKIMQEGFKSSEERFNDGILGLGCVPVENYKSGSGNQVFVRALSDKLIQNFSLNNFALGGQIFVLIDPKAFERMPYSYLNDHNGVRNPNFYHPFFAPQNQAPTPNFKGKERIKDRLGFGQHIEKLNQSKFPVNETMFDLSLGSKYIRKLIVQSEEHRIILLAELYKAGIYYIGDLPIEKAVVISKTLQPDLVEGYHEANPYKEVENDIEYL